MNSNPINNLSDIITDDKHKYNWVVVSILILVILVVYLILIGNFLMKKKNEELKGNIGNQKKLPQ